MYKQTSSFSGSTNLFLPIVPMHLLSVSLLEVSTASPFISWLMFVRISETLWLLLSSMMQSSWLCAIFKNLLLKKMITKFDDKENHQKLHLYFGNKSFFLLLIWSLEREIEIFYAYKIKMKLLLTWFSLSSNCWPKLKLMITKY